MNTYHVMINHGTAQAAWAVSGPSLSAIRTNHILLYIYLSVSDIDRVYLLFLMSLKVLRHLVFTCCCARQRPL
jgi:hypothetical protein